MRKGRDIMWITSLYCLTWGEEKEINPIFYDDEVTENNVNSENLGIFNLFETVSLQFNSKQLCCQQVLS